MSIVGNGGGEGISKSRIATYLRHIVRFGREFSRLAVQNGGCQGTKVALLNVLRKLTCQEQGCAPIELVEDGAISFRSNR